MNEDLTLRQKVEFTAAIFDQKFDRWWEKVDKDYIIMHDGRRGRRPGCYRL